MKPRALLASIQRKPKRNGFAGMSELVIAGGVGTLLIMASGVALQSTGTLIKQSEQKTTLRQNSTNGLRLMRSEVERSMHLVLNKSEAFSEDQTHINLDDNRYTSLISECTSLAGSRPFKTLFGVKMMELNQPVLYGMSLGSGGFTIERCGAPLNPDGQYNETANVFISRVLEGIGAIPCRKESELKEGESLAIVCEIDGPTKAEILNSTDFTFTGHDISDHQKVPCVNIQASTFKSQNHLIDDGLACGFNTQIIMNFYNVVGLFGALFNFPKLHVKSIDVVFSVYRYFFLNC